MSDPSASTTQVADEGLRSWRLLWTSVFLGPLIGLSAIVTVFTFIGIVHPQPPTEPLWLGSMFFTFGLLFAHLIGIVPAAISAGLNILVAVAVTSRLGRKLAAPITGALAGTPYFLLIAGKNPILGYVIAMVCVSAFASWACVAIVDRNRLTNRGQHSGIRRSE